VIKVSQNYQMLGQEIEALRNIKRAEKQGKFMYPYKYVPTIISKGMFILEKPSEQMQSTSDSKDDKSFMSFYVMPKYGRNLDTIFNHYSNKLEPKTIF